MVIVFLNRGASAFPAKGPRRRFCCVLAFCIAVWLVGVLECARRAYRCQRANPRLKSACVLGHIPGVVRAHGHRRYAASGVIRRRLDSVFPPQIFLVLLTMVYTIYVKEYYTHRETSRRNHIVPRP